MGGSQDLRARSASIEIYPGETERDQLIVGKVVGGASALLQELPVHMVKVIEQRGYLAAGWHLIRTLGCPHEGTGQIVGPAAARWRTAEHHQRGERADPPL
jgi:hypothetical protein